MDIEIKSIIVVVCITVLFLIFFNLLVTLAAQEQPIKQESSIELAQEEFEVPLIDQLDMVTTAGSYQ